MPRMCRYQPRSGESTTELSGVNASSFSALRTIAAAAAAATSVPTADRRPNEEGWLTLIACASGLGTNSFRANV